MVCSLMGVDASSFIYEELRKAKKRFEKAYSSGDYRLARIQAKRVAELLRELAKYRPWSRDEYLRMASEYEAIAESLGGETIVSSRGVGGIELARRRMHGVVESSEIAGLDREFELEAEKLIARADVSWDDIAGLEEAKKSLIEAIYYSLARPEKPIKIEPPRRFLLYGPPGTGKTLLAMAASNMLKATFFNVSVDRVLSRYVGDSPRMIAAVFRVAYRRAPSLIFFDEIESLVVKRDTGREPATGVVQTFLTELDGFKSKKLEKPVIVIAATNKPWLLDEAILSRFEKRIYTPLPDREARIQIFRLNLEKKGFEIEGISYEELADLTEGYSGRDIANVCREAVILMLRRVNPDIYRRITTIKTLEDLEKLKYRVEPIKREELLEAIQKIKPPITKKDIEKYIEWMKQHG